VRIVGLVPEDKARTVVINNIVVDIIAIAVIDVNASAVAEYMAVAYLAIDRLALNGYASRVQRRVIPVCGIVPGSCDHKAIDDGSCSADLHSAHWSPDGTADGCGSMAGAKHGQGFVDVYILIVDAVCHVDGPAGTCGVDAA